VCVPIYCVVLCCSIYTTNWLFFLRCCYDALRCELKNGQWSHRGLTLRPVVSAGYLRFEVGDDGVGINLIGQRAFCNFNLEYVLIV